MQRVLKGQGQGLCTWFNQRRAQVARRLAKGTSHLPKDSGTQEGSWPMRLKLHSHTAKPDKAASMAPAVRNAPTCPCEQ